jgi:hypothetical protein
MSRYASGECNFGNLAVTLLSALLGWLFSNLAASGLVSRHSCACANPFRDRREADVRQLPLGVIGSNHCWTLVISQYL